MSEVRLVVREVGLDWSGTIHGSMADRAIAALSADPVTLDELETACGRFTKPNPNYRFFANLSAGLCDEPYDAGLVVIDLFARLVFVDSTYSSPGSIGEVSYHDGQCATDKWLRYHLADDWLFVRQHCQWPAVAAQRRQERAKHPPLESRTVFYGRPLLEFVAHETFAAYVRRESSVAMVDHTLKEIHAAWLMTPRTDLGGVCPRDVALERRNHLTWDLQDQSERWSLLLQPPPGISQSCFAYRYGGFGIHELVLYYELVRELLWSSWDRLVEIGEKTPSNYGPVLLVSDDFLASEVPRLESVRDKWLKNPHPEHHGRTPRSIIDRERARLPLVLSGHDAMIDPDCPCCQMLADMPGPMFWHLDGCHMDDDFAFDIHHRTLEDWETEQRRWEEHRKQFDAECAERERLGVMGSGFDVPGNDAIWSSSFFVGGVDDVPLGVRVFGIGIQLAELIVNLREGTNITAPTPTAQQFIDLLNRDFGNLRELLQTSEPTLAETLILPVIVRFTDSLTDVATARPDLTAKCESLIKKLDSLLDETPPESIEDQEDSDLPF